ncbi:MAG: IS66 family transposase [Rickettsia endosymbiont of Oxypoda opaca]|nr:IS66 family transposase [Rickettsia endosymbiont of Oxypoda opaca]
MIDKELLTEIEELYQIVATLNVDIESLVIKNQCLNAENKSLTEENNTLKEQLALLKAKRYGKSSEKLEQQIQNIELQIEENELISCFKSEMDHIESSQDQVTIDHHDSKQQPKRQKLPEHLAREDILLQADDQCTACGGTKFRKISDDISETLEYVPSSFKVIRHIRPRCVCTNCELIVQAYSPSKTIDKGKAGAGLLAHILIQKYCNHLPLYRQSQIYKREGIELSRSTMASWAGQCSRLLEPIAIAIQQFIFSGEQIHGDDTPVKVLAPGIGKTKIGRIWTYVLDGSNYGNKSPIAVCYFYSPDRKGARPLEHLKNFTGTLHADAYSGYNQLYVDDEQSTTKIKEAGCWAHMRRKFYEITVTNDKANIAIAILEQIGEIYKIENRIRGLDPDLRLKERQKISKPLTEKLFIGFKKAYAQLPKKSSTAKAISYALNNQKALMRFLDNGQIEIDNNTAERAMRSIAIGRKNWLFAGSDNGGHTAAILYSIIETAKLNKINPWKYLQKVLAIIQDYNSNKIADLLPWNLKLE